MLLQWRNVLEACFTAEKRLSKHQIPKNFELIPFSIKKIGWSDPGGWACKMHFRPDYTAMSRLNFDNRFRTLPGTLWSDVSPQPLENPRLVVRSNEALALLDDPGAWRDADLLAAFSGQSLMPGMAPVAQKYTGHQFGAYNPQLGDGRGLLLGEAVNADGERWDIHLKGAGRTPYSRFGDGRAVLRSCIREFLASEALHHLGIATTRALAVIGSDTPVQRETVERGALLVRLARSHVRFGHFEYLFHTDQQAAMDALMEQVLALHFPEIADQADRHFLLFEEVTRRTAITVARWQAFGFAHGVMNTDNMSILGDTFDYGPYGFMDGFDPGFVCNHTDAGGRYAFNRQPQIALWNLSCLALAFSTRVDKERLRGTLESYGDILHGEYSRLLRLKLGLVDAQTDDEGLINDLLTLMAKQQADYTRTFRALCDFDSTSADTPAVDEFADRQAFQNWARRYAKRLRDEPLDDAARGQVLRRHNPRYILRNYLAQEAIEAAEAGDNGPLHELFDLLKQPFAEQPERARYARLPPDWAKGLAMSCSS